MRTSQSAPVEVVIESTRGFRAIKWRELFAYRDLLWLLVWRDFATRYKQTLLGPLWFVLQPLLTTVAFTVVFGKFAGLPTGGVPPALFYLSGLLMWNYFSQTFQSTSTSLTNNAGLFGKVYFPRIIIPLSAVVSNLGTFFIQLAAFVVVWMLYGGFAPQQTPSPQPLALLLLPLVLIQVAAFSLGTGLWLAALTTRFRDFGIVSGFALQLWIYATPVIYPLSALSERWPRWHLLIAFNPMTVPVEAGRHALLGTAAPDAGLVLISMALTTILLCSGLMVFQKVEKSFVDQV